MYIQEAELQEKGHALFATIDAVEHHEECSEASQGFAAQTAEVRTIPDTALLTFVVFRMKKTISGRRKSTFVPRSDFAFLKDQRNFSRLEQWRERIDCGKAAAFALVSGFLPLREINKIRRTQRLEQRSVRGASTPGTHVYPAQKRKGVPGLFNLDPFVKKGVVLQLKISLYK
ncbi:hypothetical protein [Paenibacillus albidus]|uniref:hypothetical protein n=1 Tax=Paenibacillus albidus TaxID=2041023 RepID=UPI001665079B|nr:hypothetical protein [Paenibacillus albidus]